MTKAIEARNLTKHYKGAPTNAVDDISFDVERGEFFALLGTNGAGKSTTINMLCTLLAVTSGEALVNGHALGTDDNAIRKSIGVVFQDNVLDELLTARENLTVRASFYDLDRATIERSIDDLSQRLSMNDFLDQRYGRLSGGQRRKCDIARALIQRPKLLFLDEPTTGLDPQSRIDLWKTIRQIRETEDMAIVLTTHYMEEADGVDRVAIIDAGKIAVIDTPHNLKSQFSKDTLTLFVKDGQDDVVRSILAEAGLEWHFESGRYQVSYARGLDVIALLDRLKEHIRSFEVHRGDMDNVFLTVIGRRLEV
ncbi:MAG: ABC transporter ATP-binding protein [Coriobacteriia bacterium]|nr:ABC transporter ATP-binding protein [Coriobacteriia bacterium]